MSLDLPTEINEIRCDAVARPDNRSRAMLSTDAVPDLALRCRDGV